MKASLNLSNDHILCPFSLENRAANIGMSVTSLCSGRGFTSLMSVTTDSMLTITKPILFFDISQK